MNAQATTMPATTTQITEAKPAATTEIKPAATTEVIPDFGGGRYSPEIERIYRTTIKLFGFEPKMAEYVARQAASDAGAAMAHAKACLLFGKTTKDGKMTIADASKMKGCTVTNPLAIARAIQWLADSGLNFISYGNTNWHLSQTLQEWVDEKTAELT